MISDDVQQKTSDDTTCDIPQADQLQLYTFDFDDRFMDDDGTLKASVRMFIDADIFNQFKVPYEVMCRWLCTVKKNYRPVTYHNWRHAFNVCQTMFTMLFTGQLRPVFEDLEVFTLLAACLCHDLDHRGTNNAFQVKVASPLAMLYSTSVLEHHHFDHCIMILNSEGNNIFQSLAPEEYRRAIKLLEHAILSTDLAVYFKKRGDFKTLVDAGEKSFNDLEQRDLLRAMMMTACDVAAITKPWEIQQEVAQLVTAEFFEQGDIERTQLGEQPIPMMDRNKKDELPKMQVGFIDAICAPVYKLFADITDKLEPLSSGCQFNRRKWKALSDVTQVQEQQEQQQKEQQQKEQQQKEQQQKEPQLSEEQPPPKIPAEDQAPQQVRGSDSLAKDGRRQQQDDPGSHPDSAPQAGSDGGPGPQNRQSPVEITAVDVSASPASSSSLHLPPLSKPTPLGSSPERKEDSSLPPAPARVPAYSPDPVFESDAPPSVPSVAPPGQVSSDSSHVPGAHRHGTTSSAAVSGPAAAPSKALCPPHQRDGQPVRGQQNGTGIVSKQNAVTSNSDPYTTEHSLDSKQSKVGKRKTHAQAHAHAAGEKDKKKSGVCVLS
ncbi:hypothetical protein ACOMHN_058986 [Nucella lapillus]